MHEMLQELGLYSITQMKCGLPTVPFILHRAKSYSLGLLSSNSKNNPKKHFGPCKPAEVDQRLTGLDINWL